MATMKLPSLEDDESEVGSPGTSAAPTQSPEELSQIALDKLLASPVFASLAEKPSEGRPDLNAAAGDLTFGEDNESDDISLDGLEEELEQYESREMVATILGKGSELRTYAREVEDKLRHVELESIQDYVKESDNLIFLRTQIQDCDTILTHMESLLGGFQSDLGSISSEIKNLQEESMTMGLKLRNRKVAELKLARFLEEIVLTPNMIDAIVDGEVNEEFARNLQVLSKKLHFIANDPLAKGSAALHDVENEFEKLRLRAVAKGREYIIQRIYALRKPKTNIQILQQNVLLKYKYVATFLRDHGKEVYAEVRAGYIDTMNKVLSAHFRTYIQSLEKLQLDIATRNDLIGVEERARGRENFKNRSAVFALGDRASILKEIDQPAIIPHIAEASAVKFPYEVLFRSLHKLLMDTATSEYLFCYNFFGDDSVFSEIFSGPFAVINDHINTMLINSYDAIGLMLMIRITYQHQLVMSRRRVPCLDSYFDKLNILVWPRFKAVFDMHLASLRSANVRTLWEDDVHAHYVMRRYAEFSASLLQINSEHGDNQLDLNLERLRVSVDDLLVKLARVFRKQKQQTIFLINNYDMVLAVLREAGVDGGRTRQQFEDLLKSSTTVFVEELLREHFLNLIAFVKTRGAIGDESSSNTAAAQQPVTVSEVEPLVKDFGSRWKAAIELMHKDVITSFSNLVCGMEILRAALTQLLLYYTRLSDCISRIDGGESLSKDIVLVADYMLEIKKYSRTF